MIPPKMHAVIDYGVSVLLPGAPYLFGFADGSPAQLVPMILGAGTIVYSLLTRYELSVAKLIPYRAHLILDVMGGFGATGVPLDIRLASRIWWPHVLVGVAEIGVVALSWTASAGSVRSRT